MIVEGKLKKLVVDSVELDPRTNRPKITVLDQYGYEMGFLDEHGKLCDTMNTKANGTIFVVHLTQK